MRSLKIALSVFVLFLTASASVHAGDDPYACDKEYKAPASCFYGLPSGIGERQLYEGVNCNSKSAKGKAWCIDGIKGWAEAAGHCNTGYRQLWGFADYTKYGKNSLDRVCEILLDKKCTGNTKTDNDVLPLQKRLDGKVEGLAKELCKNGNCFPDKIQDPNNKEWVTCNANYRNDGKYGLCTRQAVQNFMEAYLESDDCKKKELKVTCEFVGEEGKTYECFSAAPPLKDVKCAASSGEDCSTSNFKITKKDLFKFESDCGTNTYDITETSEDGITLSFNCKEPSKEVDCEFNGVTGKTYKCYDKKKGEECSGDKNCNLTLKGPNEDKYKFESDCGTDVYTVEIGKGENPQVLTFDCAPADCFTGGDFDAGCLFPTWNDAGSEVIQGVIGENYDYQFAQGYIPRIINILLKFIAPVVVIMFVYTGVRFIMAGGDEDEINQSKEFFTYASIGLGFIILSYSVMKALYFFITSG